MAYKYSDDDNDDEDQTPPSLKPTHFHEHILHNPFKDYLAKSSVSDHEFVEDCNQSMDSLLVFAGLFSAVTTALIVESYKDLKPEPTARMEQILDTILYRMANPNMTYHSITQNFATSRSALVTNSLLFLSLFFSLFAALGALLIKQWIRKVFMGLNEIASSRRRAREHYKRVAGLKKWHMSWYISWIPMLLHLALVLFAIGVISWLKTLHRYLFILLTCISALGVAGYVAFAIIPVFSPESPFRWPVSEALRLFGRAVHSRRSHPILPIAVKLALMKSTDERDSKQTILTTPMERPTELNDDFRDATLDPLDNQLLIDILVQADTPAGVEGVIEMWRKGVATSTRSTDISDAHKLILLKKIAACALSCRSYQGDGFMIQEGSMMERATNLVRFIELFFQVTTVSDPALSPALNVISSHVHHLLERAMSENSLEVICLHANTLALLSLVTRDWSHLKLAHKIVLSIRDAGPVARHWRDRGLKRAPPTWDFLDVHREKYQQLTTPYFYHLTLVVLHAGFDSPLEEKAQVALREDVRVSIEGSYHKNLPNEETWVHLGSLFCREWGRIPNTTLLTRNWLTGMMHATGWWPYENADGSVSIIRVNEALERKEQEKALVSKS